MSQLHQWKAFAAIIFRTFPIYKILEENNKQGFLRRQGEISHRETRNHAVLFMAHIKLTSAN